MYSLEQVSRGLRRGLSNPSFLGRELNRLYYRRLYRREFNAGGVDVVAADWDNLVILDACRYDAFEAHHDLPGELRARQSRGSHTTEFLAANFGGRTLADTVYVTANPQFHRLGPRIDAEFHAVVNAWDGDGWDERHGTVLPSTTSEYARETLADHPRKRLVVHYIQPHYPFLRSDDRLDHGGLRALDGEERDLWAHLMRGTIEVPAETVWDAYVSNLRLVLPEVRSLLADLEGRTVVTADHGNMFGERAFPLPIREWGHPPGIYTDQLVTVPWLVYDDGVRRDVVADEGASERSVDATAAEDRLRQLGYVA